MARQAKPWFWEQKQCWYVTINKKRTRLSKDKQAAFEKFYALKASEKQNANSAYLVTIMDQLLTWTQKNRSAGTYRFYHEHAQNFVDYLKANRLTAIECQDLTVALCEDYLEECSPGRRNGAVQTIKRVYNWALKRNLIAHNPIRALEKPAVGRRNNYITNTTFATMLNHAHADFCDLLQFCWETGCRPQEAWRLTASHVEKQFQRCRLPRELTKRKKSDRTIYCTDTAWAIVLRRTKSGYIFKNTAGTGWNRDNVGCRMGYIAQFLDKRYAMYDIRHTWITNKVKTGLDVHLIAKLAGTSIAMIEKYYDHSVDDADFMLASLHKTA